jgi:S-adenosylmethionine:tRNA ribosyltransferase-isomerase
MDELPTFLAPGDLLVVNDAATLPGSLRGEALAGSPLDGAAKGTLLARDEPIEARLIAAGRGDTEDGGFRAVLFGAGDWRARTEDRPPPPPLAAGARLRFGALGAEITAVSPLSPRLVALRFQARGAELWRALYREGRPVQYSYLAHELPLWAVQTVYAARPWAFEMPSAGRPLSWEILLALRRRGVRWAALTHAAGLSATGDAALDRALPLGERFEIPPATVRAIGEVRAAGRRIVAVGTTVVRALEGAVALWGELRPGPGETDLRLAPGDRLRLVDGLLTGVHVPGESHFELLGAFAPPALIEAAATQAAALGYRSHELGDSMLILPGALAHIDVGVRNPYRRRPTSGHLGGVDLASRAGVL